MSDCQGGVGVLVRARRRALGLSLGEVASRAGCAKSYLSAVENGRRGPPRAGVLARLEGALGLERGVLGRAASLERTPAPVRADMEALRTALRTERGALRELAAGLGGMGARVGEGAGGSALDEAWRSGLLGRLVERLDGGGGGAEVVALPAAVPLINRVAAGYPADFTDLGYPARVADEYIRVPELRDPDAFAARVVGDSMEPAYVEGDIVVFSPSRDARDGSDCFVRLEPDHETTFKRVYFERDGSGREVIRVQPLNSRYASRTYPRERVAGLYPAVSVTRAIGP